MNNCITLEWPSNTLYYAFHLILIFRTRGAEWAGCLLGVEDLGGRYPNSVAQGQ